MLNNVRNIAAQRYAVPGAKNNVQKLILKTYK